MEQIGGAKFKAEMLGLSTAIKGWKEANPEHKAAAQSIVRQRATHLHTRASQEVRSHL
jgi:hypothetical protein